LVPSVEANGVDSLPAHRRAQAVRMIRKRAPLPQPPPLFPPIIQVGEDPAEGENPTGTVTTTGTGTTTTGTGTSTGTGTTTVSCAASFFLEFVC
jgi:hypothetical protein